MQKAVYFALPKDLKRGTLMARLHLYPEEVVHLILFSCIQIWEVFRRLCFVIVHQNRTLGHLLELPHLMETIPVSYKYHKICFNLLPLTELIQQTTNW